MVDKHTKSLLAQAFDRLGSKQFGFTQGPFKFGAVTTETTLVFLTSPFDPIQVGMTLPTHPAVPAMLVGLAEREHVMGGGFYVTHIMDAGEPEELLAKNRR